MILTGKSKPVTEEQKIARDFLKNMDAGQGADLGQVPLKYRDHILMLCTPEQLQLVEQETLDRIDTDRFWQKHCETRFGIKDPSMQSWRDSYFYEVEESKEKASRMKKKINALSEKQKLVKASKATPVLEKPRRGKEGSLSFSEFNRKPLSGGIKKTRHSGGGSHVTRGGSGAMPALMKQSFARLQSRSVMSNEKMH